MKFDYNYIDLAFVNGKIITVNKEDAIAEAVGVKGNKIAFVGSDAELKTLLKPDTKIIDLNGRSMMPGFVDSHIHPILAGLIEPRADAAIIDTFYGNCGSLAELLSLVRKAAALKNPGDWISMMGYEPMLFPERRHPTIDELDAAAPDNPVHCMHGGGHICMYNTKALEYLEVFTAEDAKRFPKDEVEVADGRLTGMVRGHTHFTLWGMVGYTEEQQQKAAMKSHDHFLKNGITSIHDCGELGKSSYHMMQRLCKERTFTVRTYMMLHSIFGKAAAQEDNEKYIGLGLASGLGDSYFKIGGSKFMIDGGSGAPSCATKKPYSHDSGLPRERGWEREEVADYIGYLNDADCQATAHAIGDLAVEFMVEGYEKAFAENPKPHLRHRIEHCSLVDQNLIDRMSRLAVCPTVNAGMLTSIGKNYTTFYGERMKYMIALSSMLSAGVKVAIASDYPSGPVGLAGIDGAVNRYDRVSGFQTDQTQCISVLDAIRCATLNGAYASFEDNIKGSVEVGKLADFAILSEDILEVPKEELNRVRVDMTVIDGKIQYTVE